MKNRKHRLSSFLLIAVLVASMVAPAFASNHKSIISDFHIEKASFTNYPEIRTKDDKSPVYLYITDSQSHSVYARTMACSETHIIKNCTTNKAGSYVDCVKTDEGIEYGIHSRIKEDNYNYATLSFMTRYYFGTSIYGKWSPNSHKEYKSPIVTPFK